MDKVKDRTSCGKCEYGIVGWKPEFYHFGAPLWEVRCALLNQQKVQFCSCKSGQCQREYLTRVYMDRQKEKDWLARLPKVLEAGAYVRTG